MEKKESPKRDMPLEHELQNNIADQLAYYPEILKEDYTPKINPKEMSKSKLGEKSTKA